MYGAIRGFKEDNIMADEMMNNRIGSFRFDDDTILEVGQPGGGGAGVGGPMGLYAKNLVTGEETGAGGAEFLEIPIKLICVNGNDHAGLYVPTLHALQLTEDVYGVLFMVNNDTVPVLFKKDDFGGKCVPQLNGFATGATSSDERLSITLESETRSIVNMTFDDTEAPLETITVTITFA